MKTTKTCPVCQKPVPKGKTKPLTYCSVQCYKKENIKNKNGIYK